VHTKLLVLKVQVMTMLPAINVTVKKWMVIYTHGGVMEYLGLLLWLVKHPSRGDTGHLYDGSNASRVYGTSETVQ
jgi:hypothetical protein